MPPSSPPPPRRARLARSDSAGPNTIGCESSHANRPAPSPASCVSGSSYRWWWCARPPRSPPPASPSAGPVRARSAARRAPSPSLKPVPSLNSAPLPAATEAPRAARPPVGRPRLRGDPAAAGAPRRRTTAACGARGGARARAAPACIAPRMRAAPRKRPRALSGTTRPPLVPLLPADTRARAHARTQEPTTASVRERSRKRARAPLVAPSAARAGRAPVEAARARARSGTLKHPPRVPPFPPFPPPNHPDTCAHTSPPPERARARAAAHPSTTSCPRRTSLKTNPISTFLLHCDEAATSIHRFGCRMMVSEPK